MFVIIGIEHNENRKGTVEKKGNKWKISFFVLLSLIILALALGGFFFLKMMGNAAEEIAATNTSKQRDTWKNTNSLLPKKGIVFVGDSITQQFKVEEYFGQLPEKVINRGIEGEYTKQILKRMDDSIYQLEPSKLVLLIGTNDFVNTEDSPKKIAESIKQIITETQLHLPETAIFVQSIYPVNRTDFTDYLAKLMVDSRTNKEIQELNTYLKEIANETQVTYIDVYPHLLDKDGELDKKFSKEGLHLNEFGYQVVKKILFPYLEN